ncbi:hypothetical protein FF011L_43610 [Roseimaritima multifibrata]|uniref:Uncharacterized protein n=1 Tax=Roseimaritima multifibrata TaxID=1930274 RepID=A0A517ML13_9BACT|nr:hypothetical protein FF011L_43610 [Roseimaritima multifibrata]
MKPLLPKWQGFRILHRLDLRNREEFLKKSLQGISETTPITRYLLSPVFIKSDRIKIVASKHPLMVNGYTLRALDSDEGFRTAYSLQWKECQRPHASLAGEALLPFLFFVALIDFLPFG